MKISLTRHQYELLQAVDAGTVARHRIRMHESPKNGDDLRHEPDPAVARHYHRVTAQIAALRRLGLVQLVHGTATDPQWPWQLTVAGRTVVDHFRDQAANHPQEAP